MAACTRFCAAFEVSSSIRDTRAAHPVLPQPDRSSVSTITSHHMLDVAKAAAKGAADIISAAAADPSSHEVREKSPKDFVTQVDVASEKSIAHTLLRAFPDHAMLGEESAGLQGRPGADHVWIVDPLDGTTNFIHGYPAYAVSIALAVRGRVELGVVLDVVHGELFEAVRGEGAFCNGRQLEVSRRSRLSESVVATSCPPHAAPSFAVAMQMLSEVMQRAGAIRRSGSAALDLAWVAAGRCDACFDLGLNAWDVAAGALLVTEAGGRVSTFGDGPEFLDRRECLAANPSLHAELAAILLPFASREVSSNTAGNPTP